MIQDRIVVTKPTRVLVSVDRDTSEAKRTSIIDEIVAEWWVESGTELELEPWVEAGIRHEGWSLKRYADAHVVPEVDGEVGAPNWRAIAEDMAAAVRRGEVAEALDMHEVAALQQAMVDEPPAHEHQWGEEPEDDTVCAFEGCRLRYEDRA